MLPRWRKSSYIEPAIRGCQSAGLIRVGYREERERVRRTKETGFNGDEFKAF